jgi:hypothetical protein
MKCTDHMFAPSSIGCPRDQSNGTSSTARSRRLYDCSKFKVGKPRRVKILRGTLSRSLTRCFEFIVEYSAVQPHKLTPSMDGVLRLGKELVSFT